MLKKLTLKDKNKELKLFNRRLIIVTMAIAVLTLLLLSRLLYLQVWQHHRYTTLSKQNQLSIIPLAPTRGLIYDRNGVLLAENIPVYSLDIVPDKIKNLTNTLKNLNKIIPIDDRNIAQFYKLMGNRRPFQPIPLKIKLTASEVARFAVNRWRFPGVAIHARLMRYYPLGVAMAHVVGFMGRIDAKELTEVDSANYSATNYIGKIGVEKYFEKQLHGQVGYQQVEIDANGRLVRILKRIAPIAGSAIYLTIDSQLEQAAEKAMGDHPGALVAIQPSTGQVLALVSNPSFDPNAFVQGISQKAYKALQGSSTRPLYNRAIRGLYAPGSTIKPFISLETLTTKTTTPNYTIYDPGYFEYGHHLYWDWQHKGHGWVDLKKAIIVSCDTYFYHLALKLGIKKIDTVLNKFGFGQSTHIEMGEELPGLVPSPAWKLHAKGASWYKGDTIITAIGQGYLLTTPQQLASATATLAERGMRMQPHLLLKMKMPNHKMIDQLPTRLQAVNMPNWDWNFVRNAMEKVVTSPEGTGFRFGKDTPYTAAAKTGTAQVFTIKKGMDNKNLPVRLRDNSLFIVYAPVQHPQIAVAVILEHNDLAASIARKVVDYYLLTEQQLRKKVTALKQ